MINNLSVMFTLFFLIFLATSIASLVRQRSLIRRINSLEPERASVFSESFLDSSPNDTFKEIRFFILGQWGEVKSKELCNSLKIQQRLELSALFSYVVFLILFLLWLHDTGRLG